MFKQGFTPASEHRKRAFVSAIGAALLLAVAAGGCAKTPTVILIDLSTEASVSPLLLLNASVVADADPTKIATASFVSQFPGTDADRPSAYRFPFQMPLSVPSSFIGPVTVTIEGLDWDTSQVIARGSGPAQVIKEQQTMATVVLAVVVPPPTGDGGGDAGDAATD